MDKTRRKDTRKLRATATIDTFSVAQGLSAALRRMFGDKSAPVKRVAQLFGVDPRTARNYWEAANCPRAPELLRAASASPEVFIAIAEIAFQLTEEDARAVYDIIASARNGATNGNPDRTP